MKRGLVLVGVLILLSQVALAPTQAATKARIPLVATTILSPTVTTNFSGGDEVSQLLTQGASLFLLGTIETTTSPLITSPALGGSDGFLVALNGQGGRIWDLRLGTSGDDVATAGYVDTLGNIWITGSSAVPINGASSSGLNRLSIWEVSPIGVLLNTFTKDLAEVDIPTSITLKGSNFIIQGVSNKTGSPTFALSLSPLGKIGNVKALALPPAQAPKIFMATSAAYLWQGFVASKVVKGVTGVSLHPATNLLLRLSLKDKSVKGAYSLSGAPIAVQYQVGIGVIVLSQRDGTYFLTILHTK